MTINLNAQTNVSVMREDESYHVLKQASELVEMQQKLHAIQPAVSIFGSARIQQTHPFYQQCQEIAQRLSDAGFAILSGGGPGLMEAANKGAFAGKSSSIGLNIKLPHEQKSNDYQDLSLQFSDFSSRKATFIQYASAFVVMPGGFGTLDELFEVITLIQTGKIKKVPVILCGSHFWQGLIDWIAQQLQTLGTIGKHDLEIMQIIDEPQEILELIIQQTKIK